jgi:hypothetical protein
VLTNASRPQTGSFDAYTTVNYADGSGMKLFVRRTRLDRKGILLFSNQRWIDAKWSPDSRFLAVTDDANHMPKSFTYNVKWDVAGWRPRQRSSVLTKEVRNQETHTAAPTQMIARIETKSLVLDQPILR